MKFKLPRGNADRPCDDKVVTLPEYLMALVVTLTFITMELQMMTLFMIPGELILYILIAVTIAAMIAYAVYRINR